MCKQMSVGFQEALVRCIFQTFVGAWVLSFGFMGCEASQELDVDIESADEALVSAANALGCSSVQIVDFCTSDDDCNPGGAPICRQPSECIGFSCTVPTTLARRTACEVDGESGLCDGANGCCVTCIDSSDCALGDRCGIDGCEACQNGEACGSCPANRRVWRTVDQTGECVECVDSDDCPNSSQTCDDFQCSFPAGPVCADCEDLENGEVRCEQGDVATQGGEEQVWDGNNYTWSCILGTEIIDCQQCTCQPNDDVCDEENVECGFVDNGCAPPGISCGSCPSGESCYFGQCEPTVPAPVCRSCANLLNGEIGCEVGLAVGRAWNGNDYTWQCVTENNQEVDCGSCGCNPLDVDLACVNRDCGLVSDGCQGTLSCGSCGAGQNCQAGVCTDIECTQELWSPARNTRLCGDAFDQISNCNNTRSSTGTVCPNGLMCVANSCQVDPGCTGCEPDQACINSSCVDVPSCQGVNCDPATETCFQGECRDVAPCELLTCPEEGERCVVNQNGVALCDCSDPNQRNCGNGCIDILADASNCGGCGIACDLDCAAGACIECNTVDDCPDDAPVGEEYVCVSQTRTCELRDIQCPAGQTLVDGECVPACNAPIDCPNNGETGDPCTEYACDSNVCKIVSTANGTVCDNAGSGEDQCLDGVCVDCIDDDGCTDSTQCNSDNECGGCLNDGDCDDDRDCTTDTCDDNGVCQYESTCAADEFCVDSGCVECENNSHCNDSDTCTEDSCGSDGSCDYEDITCPGGEQNCTNGVCPECSTDGDCNDFDLCTEDICEQGSCFYPDVECGDAVCDLGVCVECTNDGDCRAEFYCSDSGRCEPGNGTNNPDGLICNGVEVNPLTDPMNCGNCGTACQTGAACINGVCDNSLVGPEPVATGCACNAGNPLELGLHLLSGLVFFASIGSRRRSRRK